uniref:Dynein axonemal intermediate chain 4 n=1 Tax=Strigamia maritima TaxID=126957 RepID=T1IMP6_STRMM
MAKSVGRSRTGSLVPSTGGGQHVASTPRTGTESTLKLKTGSKQMVENRHDKAKISYAKHPLVFDESGVDVTPRPLEKRSFVDVPIKTTSLLIGAMDTPFHPARQEIQEEPTSQEALIPSNLAPNTVIQVVLNETDTNFLFELEGLVIQAETEEAQYVFKRNEAYRKSCVIKETSDSFTNRPMQTLSLPPKHKGIQTVSLDLKEVGSDVNHWLMYDTYLEQEQVIQIDDETNSQLSDAGDLLIKEHSFESIMEIFRESSSERVGDSPHVSPIAGISRTSTDDELKTTQLDANATKSEPLRKNLFIMERMINMNLFQKNLATYKHLQVFDEPVYVTRKVEDSLLYDEEEAIEERSPESPEIPETITIKRILSVTHWEIKNAYTLLNLFSLYTPKLAGYGVNCIDFLPDYPDLIGIGYGDTSFTSTRPGFAACWSLKNLRFPERISECKLGVTAISFSKKNPALLAVGLHDGTIMLGLVREQSNTWIMDSSDANELHIGPIWKLLWIQRTQGLAEEKKEFLLSACEDAHICQWFLRKGMESVTLMRVKQTTLQADKKQSKKADISIAKYASVFCIAFHPNRENIYLVGTAEGCIHECSSTNSDHFIATYIGHSAPIYEVCWSPFVDDLFLSCSADWSIRLWSTNDTNNAVLYQSTPSIVLSVCWSPVNSTIFAALHSSEVEVWDLTFSTMDPVAIYKLDMEVETEFRMLSFNLAGDALFVGDKTGRLTALGLANFPKPPANQKQALTDLVATSIVVEKKVEVEEEDDDDDL